METRHNGKKRGKEKLKKGESYSFDDDYKESNKLFPPKEKILPLEMVLIQSELRDYRPHIQMENIFQKFNEHIEEGESCFRTSKLRGERIEPGYFLLGHRNNIPELAMFNPTKKIALAITALSPGKIAKRIDLHKQNEAFYGAFGVYVLNVPQNQYAKAWSGNIPKLYGPGPHVIHDNTFKFKLVKDNEKNENGYVNQTDNCITHGTIHIIRVPAGKIAKIWIGSDPYILESRKEPYVFNDATLRFNKENIFEDKINKYINHDTISILRVPAGKIAKVWLGSTPLLLPSRSDPYFFKDPYFKFDYKSSSKKVIYFHDSDEKCIEHGSIKRIIPETSEVAITYNAGKLEIIPPSDYNEPFIIDSPVHKVSGFLRTEIQTLLFPSQETKKARKRENPKASDDEVNHQIYRTKDNVDIGVTLLVTFKISNPELAVRLLGKNAEIIQHVERVSTVDMGRAIKESDSQAFLCSYQNKAPSASDRFVDGLEKHVSPETYKPPMQAFQDKVRENLARDLHECGIELDRFSIESAKIVDPALAIALSKQSELTAETNAKEAVLEQKYKISQREAEQDARKKEIEQKQINEAKISSAKAALKSAKLNAKAKKIEAEGEKNAAVIKGQQYDNPKLFELAQLEIKMKALSSMQQQPYPIYGGGSMMQSPFGFFSGATQSPVVKALQQDMMPIDHEEEKVKKTSVNKH